MTHVFHRSLKTKPPVAVSGSGVYLTDSAGKRYIDASGGAAVSCLGHAHPEVLAAMHAQIDKLTYAHTSFFTTDVAEELADRLIADAPAGLDHVYFVSGGSEAMEAALKMARQYENISLRANKVITATLWVPWRSAEMLGGANHLPPC